MPVQIDLGDGEKVTECWYFNSDSPMALVAVGPDAVGLWAAYVGANGRRGESERDTLLWVAIHGCKLNSHEARQMVPERVVQMMGGMDKYRI